MNLEQKEKAYLILADGTVFEGESVGVQGEVLGEAVFTTAMSNYIKILTDQSNYGQIVVHTFPMIGNYGMITKDVENLKPALSGYVVRELCDNGSNFRMESEFSEYLIKNGVVGISGIDTREVTRKIRDNGVMGAMITNSKKDLELKLKKIKSFKIADALKNTSSKEISYLGKENGRRIVLWDFGAKASIERELIDLGARVITVPYDITAEEILKLSPHGIILSDGGGDPAANVDIIKQLAAVCTYKIPIFGIGLGHQLLALARGGKTKKLKHGHRSANQPVKDIDEGNVIITLQNHGYIVVHSSLSQDVARMNYVNVNDKTCEGLEYSDMSAFSVQFLPEGSEEPHNTKNFLYSKFLKMTEGNGNAKK